MSKKQSKEMVVIQKSPISLMCPIHGKVTMTAREFAIMRKVECPLCYVETK